MLLGESLYAALPVDIMEDEAHMRHGTVRYTGHGYTPQHIVTRLTLILGAVMVTIGRAEGLFLSRENETTNVDFGSILL